MDQNNVTFNSRLEQNVHVPKNIAGKILSYNGQLTTTEELKITSEDWTVKCDQLSSEHLGLNADLYSVTELLSPPRRWSNYDLL